MDHTLRRKLDRITDILWAGGVTNPVTYIEQISYLIYLKLLDEEESTRELRGRLGAGNGPSLFPMQASRYRWSKWRFKSGDDLRNFVRDEVFYYMASLVKDEPQVAEYFRPRGAGDRRSERAEAGHRRARLDRLPQARSGHQGRHLRVPAHPPRPVRPERPVPHAAPDPGVHGGDGRSRSRRHHLRSCLRHGRLPDRRRGLHPGSLQRAGSGDADLRGGVARQPQADAGRSEDRDPQPANVPKGRWREDPRLGPAGGIHPRHRRVASDDADRP